MFIKRLPVLLMLSRRTGTIPPQEKENLEESSCPYSKVGAEANVENLSGIDEPGQVRPRGELGEAPQMALVCAKECLCSNDSMWEPNSQPFASLKKPVCAAPPRPA